MSLKVQFIILLSALLASFTFTLAQSSAAGNLVTQGSNKCITTKNNNLFNGATQEIQPCIPGAPAQTWQFIPSSRSGKQLLRTSNNLCLDVPNGRGANGQALQIWQCNSRSKNQFFARDGNQIRWNGSKFCLNIRSGYQTGYPAGTRLQLYTCSTTNANTNVQGPNVLSIAPPASTTLKPATTSTTPTPVTTSTTPKAVTTSTTTSKPITTSTTSKAVSTITTTSSSATSTTTVVPANTPVSNPSTGPTNRYGKPALTAVFDQTRKRMLAWGYDDRQGPMMAAGKKIGSYYHWELNVVAGMPSNVPYIPMFWGSTKSAQWTAVQQTIGDSVPGAVFGFNEPDVTTQANMDPITAANLYYSNITQVYGVKGSNLISPAIVWNVNNWLTPFMSACDKLGCDISAIAYHIYIDLAKDAGGSVDNAVALIQTRINSLYKKFGKPIILSELGLTQAGGGTDEQMTDFMQKAARFLDNSPVVYAWALSAVFAKGAGWDNYLNSNLAFFNANGTLSALGSSYMNDTF